MVVKNIGKYPGWRHMTAAQRYNARMERIFEEARRLGAFKDAEFSQAEIVRQRDPVEIEKSTRD